MNITMEKVREHDKHLYDLEVGLVQLKNSLIDLSYDLDYSVVITHLLQNAQTAVHRLMIGLTTAQHNVDRVLEYLRAMAMHQCSPVLILPPVLRDLLQKVEGRLTSNPRLKLPYNSKTDIWRFYDILRIIPVVLDKLLVVLLTIPLTDQSLEMKIHNLPLVHPEYHVSTKYKIEGDYITVDKKGMYVALPEENSLQICLMSDLGLCTMRNALYPSELVEWCVYALYIEDEEKIDKYCRYTFEYTNRNYAKSLGGFMWVVSAIIAEKLQVRCLTETHVVDIRPPIEIVYIGNGCEGYSPHLYIPTRSTLTSEINIREWGDYFLQFNDKYSREENVGIWLKLKFKLQDKEKAKREVKTWAELQPMTYDFLNQKIDMFDDNYPLEIPTKPLLVLLIIVTIIIIAVLIAMAIKWWKNRKGIKEIKGWAKFAMEELVKLKPSHDTGSPLMRNKRELPEPTDLIYETPPYTCRMVTAQIEELLIVPETAVNLTNKPLANTASTSLLNLLTTLDETGLKYGLLKVSKGLLKDVLHRVVKDQCTADRYSKYVQKKNATEDIE